MCEGVCNKCREKSQWRFKYNKYKPLKTPSSCRDCNLKTIHKAYRALCDGCATKRKVCSACSKDLVAANLEYTAYHKVKEEEDGVPSGSTKGMAVTTPDDYVVSVMSSSSASASSAMEEEGIESAPKRSKSDHQTGADDVTMEVEKTEKTDELKGEETVSNLASGWDERKFNTIANLKYSKDRVVGSAEDGSGGASTVFSFSK